MKGKNWFLTGVISVAIAWFIIYQLDFYKDQKAVTDNRPVEDEDGGDVVGHIEEEIALNSKYPEKEELINKIRNAIDNVETLQGEYVVLDAENDKQLEHVKYAIDAEGKKSIRISYLDNVEELTTIWYEKEGKKIVFYESEGIYGEYTIPKAKNTEEGNNSKLNKYFGEGRNEEYLSAARIIVSSEYTNYLLSFEDWEFKEADFMGLKGIKLTGNIGEHLSESLSGNFEMIIDKETGVVLDFKVFNENNEIKYALNTINIEFNQSLDQTVFEKNTSGYTKK